MQFLSSLRGVELPSSPPASPRVGEVYIDPDFGLRWWDGEEWISAAGTEVLILEEDDPVPEGTPVGTIILRPGDGGGRMWTPISQEDYDALDPPDPDTLYLVPGGGGEGGPVTWNAVSGKPAEFPPEPHGHTIADLDVSGTPSPATVLFGDGSWRVPPGEGSTHLGGVTLDSFPGATDDAKLGNALAYVAAQTYKPPILFLENRIYGPFQTIRTLFSGMKLVGPPTYASFYRGASPWANRIDIQTNGAWLRLPRGTDTFGVGIERLSFYSQSSTADFMHNAAGGGNRGVLWESCLRDVGFSLFRHIVGSTSENFGVVASTWDGYWNVNNSRNISFRMGGSDNQFWPAGCLLDTPVSISSSGNVPFHLWCDFLEKSSIGPMFITCEGIPSGIRIDGNESAKALIFRGGMRNEGRNQNAPSLGSVIHMNGGGATFRDCWLSYGFANWGGLPVGMRNGVRSGEGGVVSILGGEAHFDGCYYARAGGSGVGQNVPWIYASGGNTRVRVRNAFTAADGGAFTQVPVIQAANGASIDHDSSVREL